MPLAPLHCSAMGLLRFLAVMAVLPIALTGATGCLREVEHSRQPRHVSALAPSSKAPKIALAVGRMNNKASYSRTSYVSDKIGAQARSILLTHLQQAGAFRVFESPNEDPQTAGFAPAELSVDSGTPEYAVFGDIVEFGRKETGDFQLGGLLSSGQQQVVYAKITLRLVKSSSREVLHTTVGEGTYQANQRGILSFGRYSSFDSVLNGKVLDLAIVDAVNGLTDAVISGAVKLP